MPKDFSRTRRVGEQIQRELAQLIQQELKDPRLGLVTVSGVEVSRDFSSAKVFVTCLNDEDNGKETIKALSHAAGFLRRELGRRMTIRTVPELRFYYDETIVRGNRLASLIDAAVKHDKDED